MAYRQEHPKPQFERENWMNLNGKWEFQNDPCNSGLGRWLQAPTAVFDSEIEVPFCPQSELSGIGEKDFYNAVWYRRKVTITDEQLSGRIKLHFGAVDYETKVYINGEQCGIHKGGYASFAFDITEMLKSGDNTITVYVTDDERNFLIPSGKQSYGYGSYGCLYTRTTGIWQTVWLEFMPDVHIKSFKLMPDINTCSVTVQAQLEGCAALTLSAKFEGDDMGSITIPDAAGNITFNLPLKEKHLWELGKGNLYDLEFTFGDDKVKSYFGLRSIDYRDYKFFLNGKSVFQRLVLDQGYYPDGIYTARDDNELAADIDRSMAMGFNGARLHEKVFEERFLYHCDRKGYIVWGEYPNWGVDISKPMVIYSVLPEWLEIIERDFNHPSIVGWCPLNETWDYEGHKQFEPILTNIYHATKAADPTRPCIDTSGNYHIITDIYDVHNYDQNPESFKKAYINLPGGEVWEYCGDRQKYDGKLPFFVSEYGGIRWTEDKAGWGYGDAPETEEEFIARIKGLNDALLDNEYVFAFCFTQLTDVEQEQNGLYTYDRKPKVDPKIIYPLFARKAAIED